MENQRILILCHGENWNFYLSQGALRDKNSICTDKVRCEIKLEADFLTKQWV